MEVMARLEAALAEISGMDAVTLQPAAGAHGELTGILLIRALLEKRGNPRKKILIPDSATAPTRPRRHRRIRSGEHPFQRHRCAGRRRPGASSSTRMWPRSW